MTANGRDIPLTVVVPLEGKPVGTPVARLLPDGLPTTDGFTLLPSMVVWSGTIPDGFTGEVEITSSAGWSVTRPVRSSTGADAGTGPTGQSRAVVSHDWGGSDSLSYRTRLGDGIGGALVQAFAGDSARNTRPADETVTRPDGRWVKPLRLPPGEYTLIFCKPGLFGPDAVPLTVPAG